MSTTKRAILVIFRKGNIIRSPIIRFETYMNRDYAEQASKNIHGGWAEIHEMIIKQRRNSSFVDHLYRGFIIREYYGCREIDIFEKKGNTTHQHLPATNFRNAVNYVNKICFERRFE